MAMNIEKKRIRKWTMIVLSASSLFVTCTCSMSHTCIISCLYSILTYKIIVVLMIMIFTMLRNNEVLMPQR
jgi:hypothetical protein